MNEGEPIRGELHSADASAGAALTLYNAGSLTARTLAANEYIEIHSLEIVSAAGGDISMFIGADATPGAGEYIVRGTVAVNSGIVMSRMNFVGTTGNLVYAKAPAGVMDANFVGVIRKGQTEGLRPAWRESLIPGH